MELRDISKTNASFVAVEKNWLSDLSKVHQQVSRRIGFKNQ